MVLPISPMPTVLIWGLISAEGALWVTASSVPFTDGASTVMTDILRVFPIPTQVRHLRKVLLFN